MIQMSILAMLGVWMAVLMKKDKPEISMMMILLVSFIISIRIFRILADLLQESAQWTALLGEYSEYMKILLRMIVVTYLCETASSLCKDQGYSTLGNHMELFGKITILVCGVPIIRELLSLLNEIIR